MSQEENRAKLDAILGKSRAQSRAQRMDNARAAMARQGPPIPRQEPVRPPSMLSRPFFDGMTFPETMETGARNIGEGLNRFGREAARVLSFRGQEGPMAGQGLPEMAARSVQNVANRFIPQSVSAAPRLPDLERPSPQLDPSPNRTQLSYPNGSSVPGVVERPDMSGRDLVENPEERAQQGRTVRAMGRVLPLSLAAGEPGPGEGFMTRGKGDNPQEWSPVPGYDFDADGDAQSDARVGLSPEEKRAFMEAAIGLPKERIAHGNPEGGLPQTSGNVTSFADAAAAVDVDQMSDADLLRHYATLQGAQQPALRPRPRLRAGGY